MGISAVLIAAFGLGATAAAAQSEITCLTDATHLRSQHAPVAHMHYGSEDAVRATYAAPAQTYGDTMVRLVRGSATGEVHDCAVQADHEMQAAPRARGARGRIADLTSLMRAEGNGSIQVPAVTEGTAGMVAVAPVGKTNIAERVGDPFDLRTEVITVVAEDGVLTPGGTAVTISTTGPERMAAAWDDMTFVTGPEGQHVTAQITGDLLTNTHALGPDHLGHLGHLHANTPDTPTPVWHYGRAGLWTAHSGTETVKIWREQRDEIRAVMLGALSPARAAPPPADIAERLIER